MQYIRIILSEFPSVLVVNLCISDLHYYLLVIYMFSFNFQYKNRMKLKIVPLLLPSFSDVFDVVGGRREEVVPL